MDPHIWPSKSRTTSSDLQQLCEDTGCNPEDLPVAMNNREKWRERVGDSVLAARHDDDDDDEYIYIYIYIYKPVELLLKCVASYSCNGLGKYILCLERNALKKESY